MSLKDLGLLVFWLCHPLLFMVYQNWHWPQFVQVKPKLNSVINLKSDLNSSIAKFDRNGASTCASGFSQKVCMK